MYTVTAQLMYNVTSQILYTVTAQMMYTVTAQIIYTVTSQNMYTATSQILYTVIARIMYVVTAQIMYAVTVRGRNENVNNTCNTMLISPRQIRIIHYFSVQHNLHVNHFHKFMTCGMCAPVTIIFFFRAITPNYSICLPIFWNFRYTLESHLKCRDVPVLGIVTYDWWYQEPTTLACRISVELLPSL